MTKQAQIEKNDRSDTALPEAEFRKKLVAALPSLHAFARRLCGNRDFVDDLAQETVLKAWAARDRFIAGTSFRAWTFTILRHHYFGQLRQQRHVGDYDEAKAEQVLGTQGNQESRIEAIEVLRAMETLPLAQREMLLLTSIGSASYEEVAQVWGVTIGTVKSRIARARAALTATLAKGLLPGSRRGFTVEDDITDAFFAKLKTIVQSRMTRPSDSLALAA